MAEIEGMTATRHLHTGGVEFWSPKQPCEKCGSPWVMISKKICGLCFIDAIKEAKT